jgi:hypothetical protein
MQVGLAANVYHLLLRGLSLLIHAHFDVSPLRHFAGVSDTRHAGADNRSST